MGSAVRVVFARHFEEVAKHLESGLLAFFRMVLHPVDVASSGGCGEGFAVAGGGGDFLGMEGFGEVGMDEIDERVGWELAPERVFAVGEGEFVPTDLGNFDAGRVELADAAFEETDAVFAGGFLAGFEQELEADADAEEGLVGFGPRFEGWHESPRSEGLGAVSERSDAWEHDGVGGGDDGGLIGEGDGGSGVDEGVMNASDVSSAVVDEGDIERAIAHGLSGEGSFGAWDA